MAREADIKNPTPSRDSRFSSGLTRSAVKQANLNLGDLLYDGSLENAMASLAGVADDLAESERSQLAEIARLQAMASEAGLETSSLSIALPAKFSVVASVDDMEVHLSITPAVNGGRNVSAEDILNELRKRRLTSCAQARAIANAVLAGERGEHVQDVLIAQGTLPTVGEDAQLICYGRLDNKAPLTELTDELLQTQVNKPLLCREGDVVMKLIPARLGKPGVSVTGQRLEPPKPKTISPRAGTNVRVDGNEYVAVINGVVVFNEAHVEVRRCLVIGHDLTRTSQPVKFDGEVQVMGTVGDNAEIEATGNIYLDGPVEAATVTSLHGDVVLRHGVAGKGRGLITAGRDIVARYAENANLLADRDIRLGVGALHSKLTAGHAILAEQGKGHITGGTVITDERVSVVRLGANGGAVTEVRVGVSARAMKHIRQIEQEAATVLTRRAKCQELIDQIELAVRDPSKLRGEELTTYTHLLQYRLISNHKVRKLNDQRQQVLDEAMEHTSGRVVVRAEVAENVHVSIGQHTVTLDPGRGARTVRFDEANERLLVDRR